MITIQHEITRERIQELLICALEGGINYWGSIAEYVEPAQVSEPYDPDRRYPHLDYPTHEGGAVMVHVDDEDRLYRLDLAAIERGLALLPTACPKAFSDFVIEREDADTGDLFLQLCLFGKLVFA